MFVYVEWVTRENGLRDHSFITFPKFSKKLTFLNHCYAHGRIKNVDFWENFANVLNKLFLSLISRWDQCQSLSPQQTSDTPSTGFEVAHNQIFDSFE